MSVQALQCYNLFLFYVNTISGIKDNPIAIEDRAKNCQAVIDALASEVLDVDLTHITGKSVISGDRISIRNLLEIFAGLLEYFIESAEGKVDEDNTKGELEL